MTKDELLRAIQKSRAELEAVLAGLTEEQMTDPGVMGDWSVKDILSHLTAWEAETVTLLAKTKQGKQPAAGHSDKEIDALNARWYKENKNRPLNHVLADHAGVRKQLLRQLESCSEAELNAPRPWLKNRAVGEWVIGDTFEHEAEHLMSLREWRQNKLGA